MKKNVIFLLGGIVFTSEAVWQLYKILQRLREKTVDVHTNPNSEFIEVMFLSNDTALCRSHARTLEPCRKQNCPVRCLKKLVGCINNAEKTLDVCMYTLTCRIISEAIVKAHKRGVLVRVITDQRMANHDTIEIGLFHKNGIGVQLQQPDVLMHHKFIVIDNNVLFTGSVNWTLSGFFGNFENVLATNRLPLVKSFAEEFGKLWITFGGAKAVESE